MALEEAVEKNTAEVAKLNANFDKFFGGRPGTTTAATATTGKGITQDQVKAIALKVKDAVGKEATVALIKKIAKVGTVAEMDAKYFAKFVTAAEAALKAKDDAEDDDDDDDDV